MIEVWIIQEGSRDILKLSKQEIFQSISTFSSSEEETYPPVDRHPDSVIVVQLLFLCPTPHSPHSSERAIHCPCAATNIQHGNFGLNFIFHLLLSRGRDISIEDH